jgi:cell fate regulator YaaT (PSP1 superfamily)
LVKLQLQRLKQPEQGLKKVFRKASPNDVDRWKEAMDKEDVFRLKAREAAAELRLKMKISDVECQGDGSKATFYYTAEDRIDFRELIKILARDLRVKIEMRQIGLRQEAARLGGIGVCGRELCCSSWLRDFRTVSTAAARYQQLSINPQKLAGQCGKLKCCLNYELDSYMDALKGFPSNNIKLKTKQGMAFHQKTDIFRKVIFYSYSERPDIFLPLPLQRVQEIIEMNKKGEMPENLEEWVLVQPKEDESVPTFSNVIEEGALDRFDGQKGRRKTGRKSGRRRPLRPQKSGQNAPEK